MLLDYVTHVNVADGHDAVDKIRVFAVSKGWVQQRWEPNMSYLGTAPNMSFQSASGCCYLCLTSTGYGTTPLIARMGILPGRGSYHSGWNYFYLNMASGSTIDFTSAVYPTNQLSIASPEFYRTSNYGYSGMDLGVSNISKMWIFGNSKWIMAVINYDGSNCGALHFGQMEMFESNPSQGACRGFTSLYHPSWTGYYPIKFSYYLASLYASYVNFGTPFFPLATGANYNVDVLSFDISYSDNATSPYGQEHITTGVTSRITSLFQNHAFTGSRSLYFNINDAGYANTWYAAGPDLSFALNLNTYSGKRPMIKNVYCVQSRTDNTYKPVCRSNVFMTRFDGLTIGQELSYGTERYLVFPFFHIIEPMGFAARIA